MSTFFRCLPKPALVALALALPLCARADLLPPPNELTVIQYNDFAVYSLELLEKCKADPRCQPASADLDKIGGGPGQIQDLVVILSSAAGGGVNDNTPPLNDLGDNPFSSPTGNGEALVMGAGNEPTNTFTGDRTGSWDVQIGALTDWLFGSDLVFLLNNNQEGDNINQWLQAWAQVRIYDDSGVEQACFEFSNTAPNSGCMVGQPDLVLVTDPAYDFVTNPGDYVGAFTGYCVDKVTGAAYDLGLAGNDGDCSPDGYFVSGNLGNFADNAIFSQALNDYVYNTAESDWILSLDLRLANNTNGGEYVWITNQFDGDITTVPVPGTLLLLGAGLLLLRTVRRPTAS